MKAVVQEADPFAYIAISEVADVFKPKSAAKKADDANSLPPPAKDTASSSEETPTA